MPGANTIIMDRVGSRDWPSCFSTAGPGRSLPPPGLCLPAHPHPKLMTWDAAKRLEAIASLEDLRAGFALTHDLEIRGAGELLGDDQRQPDRSVGSPYYMEMLEQAVEALKHGKEPSLEQLMSQYAEVGCACPLALAGRLHPGRPNMRLSMYNLRQRNGRTGAARTKGGAHRSLRPCGTDHTLMELAAFRQRATALGIRRVEMSERWRLSDFTQKPGSIRPIWSSCSREQPRIC